MPTPIPFADDGDTRAYRANLDTWRTPAPRFPLWRFMLAALALPLLLPFMAAAAWLAWMCFQGVMGTPGAIIALTGIAALAAMIRWRTSLEGGMALCLIAVVGLVVLVWVVFALVALPVVAGV